MLDDERDGEVFRHLAVADLAVSARHPAGAGDWPVHGEVDGQDDSEEDEDEDDKSEEDGGQFGDDEKKGKTQVTHPSHLHTLALT